MVNRRMLSVLAFAIAAVFFCQEIVYAQVGAAVMVARRVRKKAQEQQEQQQKASQVQKDASSTEGADAVKAAAVPEKEPVKSKSDK